MTLSCGNNFLKSHSPGIGDDKRSENEAKSSALENAVDMAREEFNRWLIYTICPEECNHKRLTVEFSNHRIVGCYFGQSPLKPYGRSRHVCRAEVAWKLNIFCGTNDGNDENNEDNEEDTSPGDEDAPPTEEQPPAGEETEPDGNSTRCNEVSGIRTGVANGIFESPSKEAAREHARYNAVDNAFREAISAAATVNCPEGCKKIFVIDTSPVQDGNCSSEKDKDNIDRWTCQATIEWKLSVRCEDKEEDF